MKLKYYMRGIGIGIIVAAFLLGRHVGASLSDDEIRARARELGMVEDSGVLQLAKSEGTGSGEAASTRAKAAQENENEKKDKAPLEKSASENAASGNEAGRAPASEVSGNENAGETGEIVIAGEPKSAADTDTGKKTEEEPKKEPKKENPEDVKATAGSSAGTGTGTDPKKQEQTEKTGEKPEEKTEEKTEEKPAGEFTIHITGGDNSYTVSKRLEEAGIVDSAIAFDGYLCAQGYDRKITPGDHTIKSGASYEEIGKNLIQ